MVAVGHLYVFTWHCVARQQTDCSVDVASQLDYTLYCLHACYAYVIVPVQAIELVLG